MAWSEEAYCRCLELERRGYAWVMERHGGMSPEQAEQAALECYPYEPADDPYRGLVFHEESWHWAMLAIHGYHYVSEHPELVDPPPEYRALR
ncbi:hypothetical protein [Kitasatospora sp. NPDC047058]|uniref:hypothetical protein n=1 Tax=Kitasatospora sp. NPDC047058 TaxID=3155620 RepID=UPI00340D032D